MVGKEVKLVHELQAFVMFVTRGIKITLNEVKPVHPNHVPP